MIPALQKEYSSAIAQHLPSQARHIKLNATAARVETRAQATSAADISYAQDFHVSLQADGLAALWTDIQQRLLQPGLVQFRDCHIVLTAKDLKLSTQRATWAEARDLFFGRWNRAIDSAFLVQGFYDLAKETVPSGRTHGGPLALTLSWRQCCLEQFSDWLARVNTEYEPAASPPSEDPPLSPSRQSPALASVTSSHEDESGWDQIPSRSLSRVTSCRSSAASLAGVDPEAADSSVL